jgi:hypothetical protein
MDEIQVHGPLSCTRCFEANGSQSIEVNGWRLINDPGLWGASDPVVLVLGQSKGNTQVRQLLRNSFDSVAFSGVRDRLANILAGISVHLDKANLDKYFSASEQNIAFASLLRCSLSDVNGKTSGSPVIHAMGDAKADAWIVSCMDQWLLRPNPRLRLVVFLGLTDEYVKRVMSHLQALHPATFRKMDQSAVSAAGIVWVFVQHPSRISENHYQRWINSSPHSKRDSIRRRVIQLINQEPSIRDTGLFGATESP